MGDLPIAIEVEGGGLPPTRLLPFLVDDPAPRVRCRGRFGQLPAIPEDSVLFDSGGVWRVERTATGIRLVLRQGAHPGHPYHALELNQELDHGEVILDPSRLEDRSSPFWLRDPLHELWVSFLLMRGRGLLVHGCGLLRDGTVHVFLGESGAGKTTLAALLDRARLGTILSDDRLVIRRAGSAFQVYGTPWHGNGNFASASYGSLARLCFLRKATSSSLRDMRPETATAALFQVCFLAGWPRTGLDFVLGMCAEICTRVPCHQLHFRPDRSALTAAGFRIAP